MEGRRKVAVVGATGIAGQQFLNCLESHPWFEITTLAASHRSAGKPYREAIQKSDGSLSWWCGPLPGEELLNMTVQDAAELDLDSVDVIFTAVESDAAKELEPRFAAHRPTFSTASAFRYDPDVPLILPGVNDSHLPLIERQQRERGWRGFVLPIPNCTTTGLAMTLAPLHERFGIELVVMTSMQAVSGAGRNGGVLSLDVLDNIIPFIPNEEEKVQKETHKILGSLVDGQIQPADMGITCTCTRVAVIDGHTETVALSLRNPADIDEAKAAMSEYGAHLAHLPSAPGRLIRVLDDPFRPQPRLDRDTEEGMVTSVGRLRADPVLPNGLKYVLVSHNTRMGAARGSTLLAEICVEQGLI